jgi:hypothetical protein
MTPEQLATAFIAAINSQAIDTMADLMTEDHVFIDSDGTEVPGRERMREGWIGYFEMVPDYRIEVNETFTRDQTVVCLGIATGTFREAGVLKPENSWSVPAAWRALIEDQKVSVWQVYVNPEPIRKILDRIGAA